MPGDRAGRRPRDEGQAYYMRVGLSTTPHKMPDGCPKGGKDGQTGRIALPGPSEPPPAGPGEHKLNVAIGGGGARDRSLR